LRKRISSLILIGIALLLVLGAGLQGTGLAEGTPLAVEIQTDKARYQAGDTVRLAITLSNRGQADLSEINLRVPLADLNDKVVHLAGGEKVTLEAMFNIPGNFYMGYIGVGAYAQCAGDIVSGQGKALVVVDEAVSNKECALPPLPDNWESVVPLDQIPVPAGDPQAKPGVIPGAGLSMVPAASRSSGNGYPDTIAVNKSAQATEGCRAYQVTLEISGTPPEVPVDVILVIDRSGSMADGSPPAMYYAQKAAKEFAAQVLQKSGNRVAVVSFAYTGVWKWWPPGYVGDLDADTSIDIGFSSDLTAVTNAIDGLVADGGTNTEAGFIRAKNLMTASGRKAANKAIVFLTDGLPTVSIGRAYGPTEPTNHNNHTIAAYNAGISCHDQAHLFTVNLLTAVPDKCLWVARDTMQKAQNAGYYETFAAADLSDIYSDVSQQLNYSATDAVVIDKIPANFELVPGSFQSSPSAPVVYDEATKVITWTAGTVGTSASMRYKIRARAGFEGGDQVPTNDYATLTYTDINENPNKTKAFPIPKVDVPAPLTVDAGDDRGLPLGSSTQLGGSPTASGGTEPYTYFWESNTDSTWSSIEANPTVSPAEETEYTVTVTDAQGCIKFDTVKVTILKGSITVKKIMQKGSSTRKFPIYVEGGGRTWSMLLADGESATITGLIPGTYTIRETVPMYYRLVSINPSTVTIAPDSLTGEVVVTNRKVKDNWFEDDDEVINTFKVGIWIQ